MTTTDKKPNFFRFPGNNSYYKLSQSKPAGFFSGFWHGLITPFSFLISLFNSDYSIYETNNNGGWYHFGFLIGVGAFGRKVVNTCRLG